MENKKNTFKKLQRISSRLYQSTVVKYDAPNIVYLWYGWELNSWPIDISPRLVVMIVVKYGAP